MNTTSTGTVAEEAAANYLARQGFRIIERNFRTPRCEIDIVAQKGTCLYFVEVKYRRRASQGSGLDYVTAKKRGQMAYAAATWLSQHPWRGETALSAIEVSGQELTVDTFIESIT